MLDYLRQDILPVVCEYANVEESLEYLSLEFHSYNDNMSEEYYDRYDYYFPEMETKTFTKYRTQYVESTYKTHETACEFSFGSSNNYLDEPDETLEDQNGESYDIARIFECNKFFRDEPESNYK